MLAYDAVLLFGYLLRWPLFRLLSLAKPRGNYGELAQFSRRYVWIMLRLMWGRR